VLTQFSIQKARPRGKPYKLSDGGGLYLLVQPSGGRHWRFRYRYAGKENMLALGAYPDVSLASARTKRDAAKKTLAEGKDPSQKKKEDKIAAAFASANTFGAIAAEHLANLTDNGAAKVTIDKNRWLLEDLAAPLAKRPISDITPAELLALLKKFEKAGKRETARRLRGTIGTVFRLAVSTLRATTDPTYSLQRALLRPVVRHR